MTKVRLVHSVDEHVAGEELELDEETADRFLALGYAEGDVSGDYSEQEWADFETQVRSEGHQTVDLGALAVVILGG